MYNKNAYVKPKIKVKRIRLNLFFNTVFDPESMYNFNDVLIANCTPGCSPCYRGPPQYC